MKKTLILIVTSIIFSLSLHGVDINECKTDIYYGNGAWNEYENAEKNRLELEEEIIIPIIIHNSQLLKAKYGKTKLAYNWRQGYMLDVFEVYYQLKQAGQLDGIGYYVAMAALTSAFPQVTLPAIAAQKLMEPFTAGWEQGNVDEMWQYHYYLESFKLGHRVLLVSHSQGNLFANRIHDTISPTEYRRYFANMQVASPASEVKSDEEGKGSYVTLFGDPLINPIPGSMSPNANGTPGHAFVGAYLNQSDPYAKIVNRIKILLPALDSEVSQWKTNEEFEKDTCDYRITVKHHFDPAIEMPLDVYPFAPDKKLYQVNGEWVKASCGGKSILGLDHDIPEWDGKKANECYMIDNPQKEIIAGESQCAFKVSINNTEETCYESDIFKRIGYSGSSSFPYGNYTFQVSYDDVNTSWRACRHCTNGWTNSHGDRLEIGNGAGGSWIHGGINLFVDVAE